MLYLLSVAEPDATTISNLKLQEWTYVLKEYFWKYKVTNSVSWTGYDEDFQRAVQLILKIENKQQFQTTNILIDAFSNGKIETNDQKQDFIEILQLFADEAWSITKEMLEAVKLECDASKWKECISKMMPPPEHIRTADELIKIIQDQMEIECESEGDKNERLNKAQKIILELLPTIKTSIATVKMHVKSFNLLSESDLKRKSLEIMALDVKERKTYNVEYLLAMVDHGVKLWSKRNEPGSGFYLRDTQKLAALIIVKHNRSTLLQVATGEGKSLIVAASAIMRILLGNDTDVITTSPILAERDVDELKSLYEMFYINVGHNTHKQKEERQAAYRNCQVVYGALANFQRDYLLDKFYGKGIMGSRSLDCVIVDEVDSMLLDKGNSTLYLSHEIPELDKLDSIYMHIWTRVIMGKTTDKGNNTMWDSNVILREVLKQLYGLIDEDDMKLLKNGMDDVMAKNLLEILKKNAVLDENNLLINDDLFVQETLKSQLLKDPLTRALVTQILMLIHQTISRERFISCPQYLKPFIIANLKRWIKNAKLALYLRDREDYIIDIDRNKKEFHEVIVTILDKDTGTDQANSQWDSGLHQFLQLKHGCRLTPQSLKAVFISNVSYFQRYNLLNGLSGTLGSEVERQHLVEEHDVDFLTIPTFKQKQFQEYIPYVESSAIDWNKSIYEQTMKIISKDRSILIVCETVDTVEYLFKYFENLINNPKDALQNQKQLKLYKYTRDYEKLDVIHEDKKLSGGNIIIATNLAGRGTDLKLDDKLTEAGGLHVVVTYLAANDRIEQQALGRAARKGNPGSGQLVILNTEFIESSASSYRMLKLKSQRRIKEAEHVSNVRTHYKDYIEVEENCFNRFRNAFEINRKKLNNSNIDATARELLERGILDKWAFWLDSNIPHSSRPDSSIIERKLVEFINHITHLGTTKSQWKYWVDNLAQPIALAKYLANLPKNTEHKINHSNDMSKEEKSKLREQYENAIETSINLFDHAIQNEPDFSEAAHYYKALALFVNIAGFSAVIESLDNARTLFEKRKEIYHISKGLIGNLKQHTANIDSQSNAFEEQQDRTIMILDTFIKSIDDIIGHYADEELIKDEESTTLETKLAYEGLKKTGFVDSIGIDISKFHNVTFKNYCEYNGIPIDKIKTFASKGINSIEIFIEEIKNAGLNLPTREEFWEYLKEFNALIDEEIIYHLHLSEIEAFDPELKEKALKEKKAKPPKNKFYLYPEMVDNTSKLLTLRKKTFDKLRRGYSSKALEKNNCFSENKYATVDFEKLRDFIERFPENRSENAAIKVSEVTTEFLNKTETQKIFEELEKANVLKRKTHDLYVQGETYYTFQYESLDKSIPPLYMNFIRERFENSFAYTKAAHQLLKNEKTLSKETRLPLKPYVYEHLVNQMIVSEIITKAKLKVYVTDIDEIKDKLKNEFQKISIDDFKQFPTVHQNVLQVINELISNQYVTPLDNKTYKLDREPNYGNMSSDSKTVRSFLNAVYKFVDESYMTTISKQIYRGIGTIKQFGDKCELVTHPLSKYTKLETKVEELQFMTNGQDEILVGQKKKEEEVKSWNLLLLIVFCLLIIVAGAISIATIGIILGFFMLMCTKDAMFKMGNSYENKVLSSIADITLRFIDKISKSVMKLLPKTIIDEEKLFAREEKIMQVVTSEIGKFNFANRIPKFENIVHNSMTNLTSKAKEIISNEVNNAVTNSNIIVDIKFLYTNFNEKKVDEEIRDVENFCLDQNRFEDTIMPILNKFQNNMIENIHKMAKTLEPSSLRSLTSFEKSVTHCIDLGIETMRNNRSDIYEMVNDYVLSMYKEHMESKRSKIEASGKSNLLEDERQLRVDAKIAGVNLALNKIIQHHFDLIKNEVHQDAKKIIFKELNKLMDLQLRSMNEHHKITPIDIDEKALNEEDELENKTVNLTEEEFIAFQNALIVKGKLKDLSKKSVVTIKMQKPHFDESKGRIIKSVLREKHQHFLKSRAQNYGSLLKVFANHCDNTKVINNTLESFVSSNSSIYHDVIAQRLNMLEIAFADQKSKYSTTLQKLNNEISHEKFNGTKKDFFKLCIIASIAENNKKLIFKQVPQDIPDLVVNQTVVSEIGAARINENRAIIASTHNTKQPFIWETLRVLDHIKDASNVLVIVLKCDDEGSCSSIPSVQFQLLKYINEEEDDEELKVFRIFINNDKNIEFQLKEVDYILNKQNTSFEVIDGSSLNNEEIGLLYEFKDHLADMAEISDYCERNRDKFPKPQKKLENDKTRESSQKKENPENSSKKKEDSENSSGDDEEFD